jgi:hypothetical protein
MWVASSLVPTFWQLSNVGIHCIMPLFVKVVIDLGFRGLNQEIMFTCNKQHQQFWMWLQYMLFYMCGRFYFQGCCCWKVKWSNMERLCAQLCTMSSSQCGWPNWPIFNHDSYWPMMYVVWAIFWNHHYVDLWSMFLRLAHGMSHATSGGSVSWQIMVLPLVYLVDLGF